MVDMNESNTIQHFYICFGSDWFDCLKDSKFIYILPRTFSPSINELNVNVVHKGDLISIGNYYYVNTSDQEMEIYKKTIEESTPHSVISTTDYARFPIGCKHICLSGKGGKYFTWRLADVFSI